MARSGSVGKSFTDCLSFKGQEVRRRQAMAMARRGKVSSAQLSASRTPSPVRPLTRPARLASARIAGMRNTWPSERRLREGQEDGIIKKLNDELVKLQDILQQEQKIREESENSLIRVLEDMCAKMQSEVAMERKDREGTEEIFLKLLEETCDRVQSGLKP